MCAGFSNNAVACDSSALISLADTCFIDALAELKKASGVDFVVTENVKAECVDLPLKLKSHTLPAIRLQLAINDGVFRVASSEPLRKSTDDILWLANNIFYSGDRPISVLHRGETETIALACEAGLGSILIDERTSRVLIEDAETLGRHLHNELSAPVRINSKYLDRFKQLTSRLELFRSSELVVIAYEKGFFKRFNGLEKQAVEAALYGLKFAGCSISFEEIEEYTKSLQGDNGREKA